MLVTDLPVDSSILYCNRYHSMHQSSMDSQTTHNYHCAQNSKRQKKPEKVSDPKKHRDKEAMDSFDCHGWLTLTVSDDSDAIVVTLDHRMSHIAYCPIDLPDDVDTIIRENSGYTPSQV